ncbi:MAG: hypothetical protein HYU63_08370 [Armatimonadetes bacterium]|nr:hypothetical protein [Armatimonadota bacterium]
MGNISKKIQGTQASSQIKEDELHLRSKERLKKLNESYKREQIKLALETAGDTLFPILIKKDTWESLKGVKNGIAQNLYDLGDMIIKVGKSGVKIVANKHSKDDIHLQMGERAKKLQGAIYELKTSVAKLTPQKAKELNQKYGLNLSFKAYQKLSRMEGFEGVTDPNLSFRKKTLENASHIAANLEHIPKAILDEAHKLSQSNDPKEWGEAIGYNLAAIAAMLPIPGGLGRGISSIGLKAATSLEKIGETGAEISNLVKIPLKFPKPKIIPLKLESLKHEIIPQKLNELNPPKPEIIPQVTNEEVGARLREKKFLEQQLKQKEFENRLFNALPLKKT